VQGLASTISNENSVLQLPVLPEGVVSIAVWIGRFGPPIPSFPSHVRYLSAYAQ
jgi:hypothetical protein